MSRRRELCCCTASLAHRRENNVCRTVQTQTVLLRVRDTQSTITCKSDEVWSRGPRMSQGTARKESLVAFHPGKDYWNRYCDGLPWIREGQSSRRESRAFPLSLLLAGQEGHILAGAALALLARFLQTVVKR